MKKFIILLSTILLYVSLCFSQVAMNTDGSSANSSAMLDVNSTNKGMLIPRMTQAQMEGISSPATGLSVYNTDVNAVCYFNGSDWDCMDAQSLFNKTFLCGDPLRDFRDGQTYNTIQIGNQCWMAQNLNVGIMINGNNNQTDNDTIEKYCYNNDTANCDTYGGLYQWDEMMQYVTTEGAQGICPNGWHLPTDSEWMTLEESLGMCSGTASGCSGETGWRGTDEGSKLAGNEPLWANGNLDQNANFGMSSFEALPGGYRNTSGSFNNLFGGAYFRTSNENILNTWTRYLSFSHAQVFRTYNNKAHGYSVRCIKD